MRPEFALITVSPWHLCDTSTGTGYMHVVFSADPDQALPRIITPSILEPILHELPTLPPPDPPHNVAAFVQQMLDKSTTEKK
jgi:hypothetical protein